MKIGLLLGSFDPIHIAHLNIASCVLNSGLCDKVLFVVAKHNPWKKKKPVMFEIRCKMVEVAIKPFGDKCEVCSLEKDIEPPTYSYKVLNKIREQYPNDELFLLCGSDTADKIPNWKNYEEYIKPYIKVISVKRNATYEDIVEDEPFSVDENEIIPLPMIASSTMIRNMIERGMNPTPYVTQEVYEMIKRFNLYKDGKTSI